MLLGGVAQRLLLTGTQREDESETLPRTSLGMHASICDYSRWITLDQTQPRISLLAHHRAVDACPCPSLAVPHQSAAHSPSSI